MKKTFAICLIAALMLFTACAIAENSAGLPNPITQYDSLEEINEIVGSKLCRPAVMGVSDEAYFTIDADGYVVAQYSFSVNGISYTFRCAPTTEDISGVYIGGETAFGEYSGETEYAFGEGYKLSRWLDINGQYVLCQYDPDGVMDAETFEGITRELKEQTSVVMTGAKLKAYFDELAGEYQDTYSMRAHCEVTPADMISAKIEVYWADSAWTTYRWTMTVRLGEDGLLYYTDCVHCIETYDDEGNVTTEGVYLNGSGFFGYSEGVLYWNGAADEDCRDCTFEKQPA